VSAGYSGTKLIAKLGFRPGMTVAAIDPPEAYRALLGPEEDALDWVEGLDGPRAAVHVFATSRERLTALLPLAMAAIRPAGAIWVSWPKKASKVETDLTEDAIRALALPLGLVDVKVCAVDATWSGLKLVIRKARR